MRRAGDLRRDERGLRRFRICAGKLTHENFESVERSQITNELRCQQLLFDNVFRDSWSLRRVPEPAPGLLARALLIDDGDVPGRRRRKIHRKIEGFDHAINQSASRELRGRFSRLVMMVLTMMVGWPSAQNCTRHSTELPLPFALTSSVPT